MALVTLKRMNSSFLKSQLCHEKEEEFERHEEI